MCRDASRPLLSLLLLFVYFVSLLSLPISSTIQFFFILACVHFWCSIATESEGCGVVHSIVFGMRLCADMDKSLSVVYPRKSRPFMLHSLLRKYGLSASTENRRGTRVAQHHHKQPSINGSVIDGEYEIPVPLILQSPIITSVARSNEVLWLECHRCHSSFHDHSHSPSKAPG